MHTLIQAANLIDQHLETLNANSSQCECCGHTRYEDFNEFNRHKELSAMSRKLRDRYSLSKSNLI